MKLYNFDPAPASKRVRMFLLEKDLEISTVQLNVRNGDQFQEPYTTMNPFHCIPFLELDNGTVIAESVSICRYLEELNPHPSLFGTDAEERAIIDVWNRRLELDGYIPILHAFRNHNPNFAGKVLPGTRNELPQLPVIVTRGKETISVLLDRLDPELSRSEFVAGKRISVADITGYFTINMAKALDVEMEDRYPNVHRWHTELANRPSAQL
ncbi:MAG: glutathione S-transferase family protein [Granulosicoccus sp.]|nr:glutathione S-transferase family protein [Granulosicoccus sp.]